MLISRSIILSIELFQTKDAEKTKTHVLCSIIPRPPRPSCRVWDNVCVCVGGGGICRARQTTRDNIIRRMRIALMLQTHTLIILKTYCISSAKMVTRTRVTVTLYRQCPSCSSLLSLPPVYARLSSSSACYWRLPAHVFNLREQISLPSMYKNMEGCGYVIKKDLQWRLRCRLICVSHCVHIAVTAERVLFLDVFFLRPDVRKKE
jgi:hypothetical protein